MGMALDTLQITVRDSLCVFLSKVLSTRIQSQQGELSGCSLLHMYELNKLQDTYLKQASKEHHVWPGFMALQ